VSFSSLSSFFLFGGGAPQKVKKKEKSFFHSRLSGKKNEGEEKKNENRSRAHGNHVLSAIKRHRTHSSTLKMHRQIYSLNE